MTTSATDEVEARARLFRDRFQLVRDEIAKVIVGNDAIVEGLLTGLLARGHVLLEGIPGLGKTRLVHTLADALHLKFARIQFTPDLMPGDIIGSDVLRETEGGGRALDFHPGPIFANIVLADEVNRASPKTQSALLEAMQEKSVTVGRSTYPLERPFFVLATQNPLEMEGTYPLPEAQLDRFLFKLKVDYPDVESLHAILDRTTQLDEPAVERTLDREEILEMRETVRAVPIARPIQEYAIRLTMASHPDSSHAHELTRRYLRYGASPRGPQALVIGAKVRALLHGRVHVCCADIRSLALPALRHRLLLNFEGEAERIDPDRIVRAILEATPEPTA